ncbi:unnamed protein product, partial [marine sediment metagenome]
NSINSSTHFGPSVTKTSTASGSQNLKPRITLPEDIRKKSLKVLNRMIEIS